MGGDVAHWICHILVANQHQHKPKEQNHNQGSTGNDKDPQKKTEKGGASATTSVPTTQELHQALSCFDVDIVLGTAGAAKVRGWWIAEQNNWTAGMVQNSLGVIGAADSVTVLRDL